jgi:hypothetical protein
MNKTPIPDSAGFEKRPDWAATFASPPQFFQIAGPATLVRLVESKQGRDGAFWFEEDFFSRIRQKARLELSRQQAQSKPGFNNSLDSLITVYMRHVLRDALAVSKDWADNFNGYVRVRLFPDDKLVALVGPIARQPAYSDAHPQHAQVVAKDIWLEGRATQYVVDFRFPANRALLQRIQGPLQF